MNHEPAGPDRTFRSRRVVTRDGERPACVVVRGGLIAAVEPWDAGLAVTDELGELALLPGLVDTHVHVNEPGRTDWEGFATATRAAAAGGITTIVDMPLNSIPATTTAAALREKVRAMAGKVHVDAGLWGGAVPGNTGELEGLAEAGALGFKCFLSPSGVDEFGHVSEADLREAMPVIARLGVPLLAHAEDPALLKPLPASTRRYTDWLASRPPEAEASAIRMLARLAAEYGVHVHVVHVASKAGVDAVCAGVPQLLHPRSRGGVLTAETCPHYLFFGGETIADGATLLKCAPPIRGRDDRGALLDAVVRGRMDLIASDHSPAPPRLKGVADGDFAHAWGGISSLECSLGATWSAIRPAHAGGERDHLEELVRLMSAAPARLAGLDARKGAIAPGLDADLVAFDPGAEWVVDASRLHQRHPVTPYAGRTLRGRVLTTWLRGEPVFRGGELLGEPRGLWQRRSNLGAVDPARAFA